MLERAHDAPGWRAIETALAAAHGDAAPHRLEVPGAAAASGEATQGGEGPLAAVVAYACEDPPHWHYTSFGLSELYAKVSPDPERSGFGLELTLRLARDRGEAAPPRWPADLLSDLAAYVVETGNPLDPGDTMDLHGPLAAGTDTRLAACLFAEDPDLPPIETPHGRVTFVQVVGATRDELDAARDWSSEGVLAVLARAAGPLLVTDLRRSSATADPALAAELRAGAERHGSSHGGSCCDVLRWTCVAGERGRPRRRGRAGAAVLTVGASAVADLRRMLRGRIPFGREFSLIGPEQSVLFEPADEGGWHVEDGVLIVGLALALARRMEADLRAARGTYRWAGLGELTLEVVEG